MQRKIIIILCAIFYSATISSKTPANSEITSMLKSELKRYSQESTKMRLAYEEESEEKMIALVREIYKERRKAVHEIDEIIGSFNITQRGDLKSVSKKMKQLMKQKREEIKKKRRSLMAKMVKPHRMEFRKKLKDHRVNFRKDLKEKIKRIRKSNKNK